MATIENRSSRTHTHGNAEALESLMVTSALTASRFHPANATRAAETHVRATIRRDAFTDADQRLILSLAERRAWDARNPLP